VTKPLLPHLRDDELLLQAGGELAGPTATFLSAHYESCSRCQARLRELQTTLGEFAHAQRAVVDADLPSATGPRALLKAQLAALSKPRRFEQFGLAVFNWRGAVLVASLALFGLFIAEMDSHRSSASTLAVSSLSDEPNLQFTPGAVIAVTQRDVCSESAEAAMSIPPAIKNRVLQLYGVASGHGDAYEVDYLITPELGGATDVRNLWPEPYEHTVWNAHVKDRLEDRLHEMVCHGDIDLATAQREISTDWIAAYRKYFHADVPVGSS
jgi:hypothetical protein